MDEAETSDAHSTAHMAKIAAARVMAVKKAAGFLFIEIDPPYHM